MSDFESVDAILREAFEGKDTEGGVPPKTEVSQAHVKRIASRVRHIARVMLIEATVEAHWAPVLAICNELLPRFDWSFAHENFPGHCAKGVHKVSEDGPVIKVWNTHGYLTDVNSETWRVDFELGDTRITGAGESARKSINNLKEQFETLVWWEPAILPKYQEEE